MIPWTAASVGGVFISARVMFCGDYRRVKRLGLSPTEGWTEKYKEVRNKLQKIG